MQVDCYKPFRMLMQDNILYLHLIHKKILALTTTTDKTFSKNVKMFLISSSLFYIIQIAYFPLLN